MKPASRSKFSFYFGQLRSIIIVLLLLGAIGLTVWQCCLAWGKLTSNRQAENDYRSLRTAVLNTLSDRSAPARFFFLGHQGPFLYPEPLEGAVLGPGVQANVFHQSFRRQNDRPLSITILDVFHLDGTVQ